MVISGDKIRFFLLSILFQHGIGIAHAEIFTWTDSAGVVHFSDHAEPGAKTVQISDPQTYTPPQNETKSPNPTQRLPSKFKDPSQEAKKSSAYSSVTIIDPSNDFTIRNPQGYVPVTVDIKPELAHGDGIQLLLDGNVIGRPQQTSSFSLQGIERGSHQITAQVVNAEGTVVSSSDPVTIFMMQPRVNTGPLNQVKSIP